MRVREHLIRRLDWDDTPVLLDNDANLNALAEYIWGAARRSVAQDHPPYLDVVYLEWSVGIGMGLILNGELYRGAGSAGEIGHTVVQEEQQVKERLEVTAGSMSIVREALGLAADEEPTDNQVREAVRRASGPDDRAVTAFRRAALQIGRVLGPVIHLLNPQLVVIGGEIGRSAYDVIKPPLLEALKEYTMRPALADVTVVVAELGDCPILQGATSLLLRPTKGDPDALLTYLRNR